MKATHQQIPNLYLASRLKHIDPSVERPPDRELRRLRGLSSDVGIACSSWLNNRGIKTTRWGDYYSNNNKENSKARRIQPEIQHDL
jgi:hypothetical protein